MSAAEAAAEVFAAKQVVLPLAGSRTLFPRDEVGSLLRRLLCYDGVDPDGGELEVSSDKEQPPLPLLGSYRRLLLRPRRMSWELLQASSHETHRDSREMSGQLPSWQLPKGARREAVGASRLAAHAERRPTRQKLRRRRRLHAWRAALAPSGSGVAATGTVAATGRPRRAQRGSAWRRPLQWACSMPAPRGRQLAMSRCSSTYRLVPMRLWRFVKL